MGQQELQLVDVFISELVCALSKKRGDRRGRETEEDVRPDCVYFEGVVSLSEKEL